MGSQVTLRKIRKTVHKVMLKYGKKKFYRKIDWIDKVMKKLRIGSTPNLKCRIRNHINNWLKENSEILNTKTDSKKEILDPKGTAAPTNSKDHFTKKQNVGNNSNNHSSKSSTTDHATEKKDEGNSIQASNNIQDSQRQVQVQVQEQVGTSKPNSDNIPPMPEAIPIQKLKNIFIIDLTSGVEKKVEKNEVEVITIIDDDIEIIKEKVLPQQRLIIIN